MGSRAAFGVFLVLQCMIFSETKGAVPVNSTLACTQQIMITERSAHLPPQLLHTIAIVESGRPNPRTGVVTPWPWTINAEGTGFFFDTREQAIAVVKDLQAQGVRSIDVGCMQINLMYHANAFASLEEAFEPQTNVTYAARFLKQLYAQTNAWPKAAAAYHSQTPEIGESYERQVMALWPQAANYADQTGLQPPKSEFDRRLALEAADHEQLFARMCGPAMPVTPVMSQPRRPRTPKALAALDLVHGASWHSVVQRP